MSEGCTHDCGSCSENCAERKPADMHEAPHQMSQIGKVVAVVSGKGGVGKSLVTSLMATLMQRRGHHSAILDADITGPSIPKAFGITGRLGGNEWGMVPARSKMGTDIVSVNLLLQNDTDPVVWRGPVISGVVKQFWTDVIWPGVDYMFVDMPPGTGDVPLTVFQSLPVDGIIIVTSPQELVSMIVEKAVNMAEMMNIPILGIVENMSYYQCPDCKSIHHIFGESHIEDIAKRHGIDHVAKIPINPEMAKLCDTGMVELFEGDWLDGMAEHIEKDI
jgi:Mrp family chromosome partitioning ATPase